MNPARPSRPPRALALTATLAAALLAAGCGSSTQSTAASSTAATKSAAPTTEPGIRVIGTPRFATPSPSDPLQSGVVKVSYRSITIQPDTLRVKVGSTVEWTNYDSVQHNVTSEGGPQRFISQNFGEGSHYSVTLTRAGIVHYECTNHPASMNGSIEVLS